MSHCIRPWWWERLKAGEGDDRSWDGWMASPAQWTGIWVSSRSWCWTGKPGMLQAIRSQKVGHDWVTELNWYLPYPFLCWWTFKLLACLGYCKECCSGYWGAYIFSNYGFLWIYAQEWVYGIAESYSSSKFSVLRTLHTVLYNNCTFPPMV